MIYKNWRRLITNKPVMGMLTAALFAGGFLTQGFVSLADSTGTVLAESAKVRQEASTTSEVIGSASKNAEVTIKGSIKDSAGTLWYQIVVEGDTTGYVRSDLIQPDDEGEITQLTETAQADTQTTENETAQTDSSAGGAATAAETPMDQQYATVSVKAAKIRTAPSTNDAVVESLAQDTQLIVSGQSNGSDGKVWYYVTFTGSNGAEKTGFVRSDLITLGEMLPVTEPEPVVEEEPVESAEPEEPVNSDYELVYTTDTEGNYCWYLYDHVNNNRQKLDEVLAAAHAQSSNEETNADIVVRQRLVIIVMAVLIVLFIITVIVLSIKLRNSYYYEEYDEDEEEDEEEDESLPPDFEKRSRRAAREENEYEERAPRAARERGDEEGRPRRAGRAEEERPRRGSGEEAERAPRGRQGAAERPVRADREEAGARRRKAPVQEVTYREETESAVPVKTPAKKKAKNFLLDDDDFEFEFLNMDDKDL